MARFHNFYRSIFRLKRGKKAQCVSNRCKDLFKQKKIFWGYGHFKTQELRRLFVDPVSLQASVKHSYTSYEPLNDRCFDFEFTKLWISTFWSEPFCLKTSQYNTKNQKRKEACSVDCSHILDHASTGFQLKIKEAFHIMFKDNNLS